MVLVLDGMRRKSVEICRELGRAGHEVLTGEIEAIYLSRFSRYVKRAFIYPNPESERAAFLEWLGMAIPRYGVDVVIPTDDPTVEAISGSPFGQDPRMLVPPHEAFLALRDKARSGEVFRQVGVPHPETIAVTDLAQVPEAIQRLGLPVVIKPRISAGSRGLRIVDDAAEAERSYREVHAQFPWPILQRFVRPGPRFHLGLLFDQKSRLVLSSAWQGVRQYPLHGGPPCLAVGVDRPDLVAAVLPVFEALHWVGPANIDGQYDGDDGPFQIIEINPRYWETIQIARRNGLVFAPVHVALAMGQAPPPQEPHYGVMGRSVLPYDLMAYLADPGRSRWNPGFLESMRIGDDLLDVHDPGPTVGFFLTALRHVFDRTMWRQALRME